MKTQTNISPADRAKASQQIKEIFEGTKYIENLPWMNVESSAEIQLLTARLGLYHVDQPTLAQSDKLYELSQDDWVAHIVASQTAKLVIESGTELKGGLKTFVIEILQRKPPPPRTRGKSFRTNWKRDCMIFSALSLLVDDDFTEGLAIEIVYEICNGEIAPDLTREVIEDIWNNPKLRENLVIFESIIELFDGIKLNSLKQNNSRIQ